MIYLIGLPGTKALSAAVLPRLFVEAFFNQRLQFRVDGPGAVEKLFKDELLAVLRPKKFVSDNSDGTDGGSSCGITRCIAAL